ncbi:DNA polymerase III subunit gamma and tau [Lapillicoccus sp.]|uniref:DNA polymerase III subunit gamma and tau n=1 Tax=Lapillicoccus sp. TaxID=1909287 RepID=UPI003982F8F6
MSTALYRRYRPESFADVIGQEHVTEPLMQALRTGRVNHAYLFSGPRGCGKTTSARILARCLNCEQSPTPEPCGVCDSCVALARGGSGSVDVIEIDAASHGGVDDARDLRERASYGPAQSRYKIYIIDEAHMVTPQGFNALLKIVEEPPEHVKFVFATTEPEKVIGTIRSRTHHYPFRLVPPARLTTYLEGLCVQEQVPVAPGVLGFVTRAGGGSVRDSLSVLDQLIAGSGEEGLTYDGAAALLGFTDGELLDATIDAFAAADGAAVFTQVDRLIESGHDPRRFVEDLLERLRDLIIIAAVPDGAAAVLRGVPEDQLDRMRGQQSRFGAGMLSRAADIVNTGLTEMTGATAPRLQLELICARILLPAASGESGYAARLDRLERRLDLGGTPSAAAAQPAAPAAPTRPGPAALSSPAPSRSAEASGSAGDGPPPGPVAAPPDADVVVVPPTAAGSPRETSASIPSGESPPGRPVAPSSASPGGIDAAAIRRVWPDVLARIFGMRRATWTFVSQHAQVIDYDGTKLVLGIATVGLANTFRQGNHAELVRQALIDEIGVDVPVEGIATPDAAPGAATAPPPMGEGPTDADEPEPPPFEGPPLRPRRPAAPAAEAGPGPAGSGASHGSSTASASAARGGDWGAGADPAPDGATAPAGRPADPPRAPASAPATALATTPVTTPARAGTGVAAPGPQRPVNASERAASVRQEIARARSGAAQPGSSRDGRGSRLGDSGPAPPGTNRSTPTVDDSGASADDEDIALSGAVGRAVIEKVLGGRVIGELED